MLKRKTVTRTSSQTAAETLRRTCEACHRTYGRNPNVIGVGIGLKFVSGHAHPGAECLHFYVRRKLKRLGPRRRLPRFVYARRHDGRVDRSRKICTDVIELRRLSFACTAGSEIHVIGESGTLTLLFRNKAPGQQGFFLITCAHVAGDVRHSPPVDPQITCSQKGVPTVCATTLANATARAGSLDYDIALAQIHPGHKPFSDCQIARTTTVLTHFLPPEDIRPGLRVDCAFPVSNVPVATVASSRTSLPLVLDGREYLVHNLFLLDRQPRKGDSGGLLFDGEAAAGILVGRADGWGLFQPLAEAFAYLQTLSPIPIRCFKQHKAPRKE
jgi:hypothetical protein